MASTFLSCGFAGWLPHSIFSIFQGYNPHNVYLPANLAVIGNNLIAAFFFR